MLTRIYGYTCLVLLIALLTVIALWQHARAEMGKREAVIAKASVAAVEAANDRARELQRRLDSLPKAEGKVRETVRANPAQCERPAPVADRLSEAIREANAARAMPADS